MEDLHKEATKAKEQERKAATFFENRDREVQALDRKYDDISEERKVKLSSVLVSDSQGGEEVLDLKHKNHELQRELMDK